MKPRKYLLAWTCGVFSLLAPPEPVRAGGTKGASSPEQAVEFLAAASRSGDLPACLELIAPPFHDLMRMFILEEEADDILGAALDKVKLAVRETVKSFQRDGDDLAEVPYVAIKGADGWRLLRPFTALLFFLDSEAGVARKVEQIKDADGEDTLLFKLTLQKELDELGRRMQQVSERKRKKTMPEILAQSRRTKEVAAKVAGEVRGGKYPTREAADDAFRVAVREGQSPP